MNENNLSEFGQDEWLTPREAAELLPGTSAQAVNRWAKTGKLPSITLPSGRRYIRRADIDALMVPRGSEDPPPASNDPMLPLFGEDAEGGGS